MTISAKIICDSISLDGIRLTTMQLRYPRFIHAEELTHRIVSTTSEMIEIIYPDGVMYDRNLSRNASSSRAIPVSKLIEDNERDPVYPSFWGSNKPGMQAGEECNNLVNVFVDHETGSINLSREQAWDFGRNEMIRLAKAFADAGYHKQIVNRLLEPFSHINVLVTATNYENFYALRRHPDAQPEIHELADRMFEAQQASTPVPLEQGQWHIPYVDEWDWCGKDPILTEEQAIKISVARCARVSYLTHEGKKPDIEADLKLYDRLVGSTPLHASPCEHQATPDILHKVSTSTLIDGKVVGGSELKWENPHQHGNLTGWIQYRKTLPNEYVTEYKE